MKHLAILLTAALFIPALSAQTLKIRGYAYDLKSGKYLYSERHKEVYKKGNHAYSDVYYVDPKGKTIAYKRITFTKSKTAPDYKLTDYRIGLIESARKAGSFIKTVSRLGKGKETKTKRFKKPRSLIVDGGFDHFIRQNWGRLQTGKKVPVNFAVASRGDFFGFYVQKARTGKLYGKKVTYFKMVIDNWILRMLSKPIVVAYYDDFKRLALYKGQSNINDVNGENYKTKIVFNHKQDKKFKKLAK